MSVRRPLSDRVWPWRVLRRRARRAGPRTRVIVTGRPYDWQTDGFGDDLFGPVATVPPTQRLPHDDMGACKAHMYCGFVDDGPPAVLDWRYVCERTGPTMTTNDDK